jgi:hypothetical protein
MPHYADTSFLVQLLVHDFATTAALAVHRSLGRPAYAYSPLHALEVPNALRLRLFQAKSSGSALRAAAKKSHAEGMRRLAANLKTGCFRVTTIEGDDLSPEAQSLSERFTERIGCRALDILHVAAARLLHASSFLTCDRPQATLAKAAGLKVTFVEP